MKIDGTRKKSKPNFFLDISKSIDLEFSALDISRKPYTLTN